MPPLVTPNPSSSPSRVASGRLNAPCVRSAAAANSDYYVAPRRKAPCAIPSAPIAPASDASYPYTLRAKLEKYAAVILNDREYATGLTAILVNQLGDGLVTGGFLVLLDVLGLATHSLSISAIATFTVIEICIACGAHVYSSHQRDNAEFNKRAGDDTSAAKRGYARHLLISGAIDMVAAGLLFGAAVGAAFFSIGAWPLFAALSVVKAVQAFNKSYETGSWNCIKYSLGSKSTQACQLQMKGTISSLEIGAGALLYGIGSWVIYQSALAIAASLSLFLLMSMGAIAVGGLMTCLPKFYFITLASADNRGMRR